LYAASVKPAARSGASTPSWVGDERLGRVDMQPVTATSDQRPIVEARGQLLQPGPGLPIGRAQKRPTVRGFSLKIVSIGGPPAPSPNPAPRSRPTP
jgi:hypothetical protein